MQEVPICFNCGEGVSVADSVFEAPCGHDEHPTAIWHGLCLMDWRDNREVMAKRMRVIIVDMEEVMGLLEEDED